MASQRAGSTGGSRGSYSRSLAIHGIDARPARIAYASGDWLQTRDVDAIGHEHQLATRPNINAIVIQVAFPRAGRQRYSTTPDTTAWTVTHRFSEGPGGLGSPECCLATPTVGLVMDDDDGKRPLRLTKSGVVIIPRS